MHIHKTIPQFNLIQYMTVLYLNILSKSTHAQTLGLQDSKQEAQ